VFIAIGGEVFEEAPINVVVNVDEIPRVEKATSLLRDGLTKMELIVVVA